uniref:Peptidase S1 domain-containing protein n=1 Tax=Terrapene triunguis TaxID=2587831 RepID=A0A674IQZ9_9SAUR
MLLQVPSHSITPPPVTSQSCRYRLYPILRSPVIFHSLLYRAKLNRWVDTIALPRASERVKPGDMCSVAGWGDTSTESESSPATLQEADVVVMPDPACPRKPNGPYSNYKSSTMMCVGDPKTRKDSWKGDSGGPLVCRKTAQGIVSWGPPTPPGVYTKVSTFIPWIQATMRRLQP